MGEPSRRGPEVRQEGALAARVGFTRQAGQAATARAGVNGLGSHCRAAFATMADKRRLPGRMRCTGRLGESILWKGFAFGDVKDWINGSSWQRQSLGRNACLSYRISFAETPIF